jgi:hypothetical protein
MKRFAFTMLSLPALFVLLFTSCEVNEDVYLNTKTINYSVGKNAWKVATDVSGEYWYCEFNEPLLTQHIFDKGMVAAYMVIEGRLTPLPFSDFWIDSNGYKWEEQHTCELEPGWVTFIFKTNDHLDQPNYNYDFVLKLMW